MDIDNKVGKRSVSIATLFREKNVPSDSLFYLYIHRFKLLKTCTNKTQSTRNTFRHESREKIGEPVDLCGS